MTIADVRDAFNAITLPHGIRCTGALLNYCDKQGNPDGPRDHQQLVFNCVKSSDNTAAQYTSAILPPGTNMTMAAAAVANGIINAQATATRAAEMT